MHWKLGKCLGAKLGERYIYMPLRYIDVLKAYLPFSCVAPNEFTIESSEKNWNKND